MVIGLIGILILAVIVMLVVMYFYGGTSPVQNYTNMSTVFYTYWCGKLVKNQCDLSKFNKEERKKFYEMCKWVTGRKNILLSDCKRECKCMEEAEEFFQRLTGSIHGINCDKNLGRCLVSGAALYSRLLQIAAKLDESELPLKVFYIDKDGTVYTCFKVDKDNKMFQVKFEDKSVLTGLSFSSEEAPDELGEKKVKFVEDEIAQRNYLDLHGFKWICKDCSNVENSPTGARIIITKIEHPWICPFGCVYKIWLKANPCKLASEPAPTVDEIVSFRKEGNPWEKVHSTETKTMHFSDTESFELNFTLKYRDYYGKINSSVIMLLEIPVDKEKFLDAENPEELKNAKYLGKQTCGDKILYAYECENLKDEKNRNICEIILKGVFSPETTKKIITNINFKTYDYAITDAEKSCDNGGKGYFTYPASLACNNECIKYLQNPKDHINDLVSKCESGREIEFTIEGIYEITT